MIDNMQKLIDKHLDSLAKQRSKEMFTLGNLIDELEKYPKDWGVYIEPFHLVPNNFCSYRGYYRDLNITVKTRREAKLKNQEITVGEFLEMAKEANGKTFYGYKGGEFTMNRNTPIWVGDDDYSTGVAIAEVKKAYDGLIEIHCYQREE